MARPEFDGTNFAAEHIGKKASDNLHAAAFNADSEYVDLEIVQDTEGDIGANIIGMAVQARTRGGALLPQAVQLLVRVHDANLEAVASTAAEVAASGGAALDSPASQAAALITLGADGAGIVSVEDATAALAGDLVAEIEVVGRAGVKKVETLTFA